MNPQGVGFFIVPTGGGTPQLAELLPFSPSGGSIGPGPQSLVTQAVDFVSTPDATPVDFPNAKFACPDNTAIDVIVTVVARSGADVFCQDYRGRYVRHGGALALVSGTSVIPGANPIASGAIAAATATLALVGNSVVVQVTGVAATVIDWSAEFEVQQVQ